MASKSRVASKPAQNGHAPRAGDRSKLRETVNSGDYRAALDALADELVQAMEDSPPGAKAQTAAQLRGVLKERAALPDVKKVSKADELASRRAARLAEADAHASAVGEGGK